MGEFNELFIKKMLEMTERVKAIQTNIEWLMKSEGDQADILQEHDKRLTHVEKEIMRIIDRRGVFFKAIKYVLGCIGWKL